MTLNEIQEQIKLNIKNGLGIASPLFGANVINVLSKVMAGVLYNLYLRIEFNKKQMWVDTASSEENGGSLEGFGRVKLGREKQQGSFAEYTISVTGSGTVSQGTQWVKNGLVYTQQETITAPSTVNIVAEYQGDFYNLSISDTLSLAQPITGIGVSTVSSEITKGRNKETDDEYRASIIESFRTRPNGGSVGDFRAWAQDVAEVRRIYPYTASGGEINIYVEANRDDSTDNEGTPTQATLDALWKNDFTGVLEIDPDTTKSAQERGRRPLGVANINMLQPIIKSLEITIRGLTSSSIQNSIEEAIKGYLYNVRPFLPNGDDIRSKNNIIFLSSISASIFDVLPDGESFTSVTMNFKDQPDINTYELLEGEYAKLSNLILL